MILLKDKSVVAAGLQPELYFALGVAAGIHRVLFGKDLVVTSLLDGKHNCGSLHPKGFAADLRTLDLTVPERYSFFAALQLRLPAMGFDVVWEGGVGATPATTGAHIHIEYDPKGRAFWTYLPAAAAA
jgi:hypothetical protein